MIDIEAIAGDQVPGAGPTDKSGYVMPVPTGVLTQSTTVVSTACRLMGWSFRENTGTASAQAELISGGDDNGSLLAVLGLDYGFDPAASQTPADATAQGAASAIAPSIGGAAGTLAFITSFRIEGLGATAGSVIQAVLNGVLGGAITYEVTIPAGAAIAIVPVTDQFGGRGLPASGAGVAITLNVPSFGAGNTFSEAEVQGFIQTAAVASDTQWLGDTGILADAGVRVRVISGAVRGSIWVRR